MDVIRVVVVEYIYILIACAGGNRKATGLICKDFTGCWDIKGCRIAVMGSKVVGIRWWKERIINRRRVRNWFINRLGRTSLGVFLCRALVLSRLIEMAFDLPTTGKIFTDQTGRFPITSSTGNQYVFVLYNYDYNYIHAISIKNRKTNIYLLLTKQHMLYLYAQFSVLVYNYSTTNAQTS